MTGCCFKGCLPRREQAKPAKPAEKKVATPTGASEVEVVALQEEWCELKDTEQETGQEHFKQFANEALQARERRLTAGLEVLNHAEEAGIPLGDMDVEVIEQSHEWGDAIPDSDEEGEEAAAQPALERLATSTFEARERRLTVGAEVLQLAQQPGASSGSKDDLDRAPQQRDTGGGVTVVAQSSEWGGMDDSDEDVAPPDRLTRLAADASLARERRLTAGAEAITLLAQATTSASAPKGAVVQQAAEWQGLGDDSDGEASPEASRQSHAAAAHVARERRLTAGAEAIAAAQAVPASASGAVAVVSEGREWAELEEEDEEEGAAGGAAAEQHAASAMAARERRLTAGAEAIAMAAQLPAAAPSGQDVAIVEESKEWGELEEDEETVEGPSAAEKHASGRMAARERRLTVGAEAIAAAQAPAASERDVAVVVESKEWAELDDDDEDAGGSGAEQHATAALAARERRLTAGAEALALAGAAVASRETAVVVTESGEWGDDDSDEEPGAAEQHASSLMAARERRLTAGAEAIARLAPVAAEIGERDVAVVSEEKEWAELDDEEEDQGGAAEQHASSALAARERRLTAGAEALALAGQLAAPLASGDVALVAEGKEWVEDNDEDEVEEGAAERHASSQLAARERRLTAGAEAIAAAAQLGPGEDVGQRDVAVVESGEWAELEEEEEEEAGAAEQHASARLAARERRLTAGAEAIALAAPRPDSALAEKDVAVVAESQEWAELDSDEEEGKGAAERHASEKLAARERRLTAGAEALALSGQLAQEPSAPKDVELVTASTEWGELGGDSDEEGPETLARHAAGAHGARERRLTAGAEAIAMAGPQLAGEVVAKDVAVVEQEQEWGEGDSEDEELDRHAASAHQARERRLTAVALAGQALPTAEAAAKDVAIVDASAEWGELEDDSEGEDGPPAEDERCRRASASHQARERRLSAGAEVLQLSG